MPISRKSHMDRDDLSQLVEEIYNAALLPDEWNSVVDKLRLKFNSISAGFFSQSADNRLTSSFMRGVDQTEIDIYSKHFSSINPWFTTPGVMNPGVISTDRTLDIIYNDPNFFRKTVLYQEWGKRQDFRHSMGGALLDIEGNQLNFTFYRSAKGGHYTESELRDYRLLSRHLMKALDISNKLITLNTTNNNREKILNKLNIGIVILDRNNRIVYTNPFSEGINFYCNSVLTAIEKAKSLNETILTDIPRPNRRALSVCVRPPNKNSHFLDITSDWIHLIITDPECRDINCAELLSKRWGFTKLESNIAQELLRGRSLREIAEELHLALSTVQWYSKQLMQKVGVKRQSELCLILLKESIVSIDF